MMRGKGIVLAAIAVGLMAATGCGRKEPSDDVKAAIEQAIAEHYNRIDRAIHPKVREIWLADDGTVKAKVIKTYPQFHSVAVTFEVTMEETAEGWVVKREKEL
jgi:hypothetical protein